MDYNDIVEINGYKKIALGKAQNLHGQKFGRLTALYRTKNLTDYGHATYWLCKCDCGNYHVVRKTSLLNGSTQSCGCYNKDAVKQRSFVDITGQKFGQLTALCLASKTNQNGNRYWECRCDCGKTTIVQYSSLVQGRTISCGCYQREKAKKQNKKNIHDLTGRRFGKLTVLKQDLTAQKRVHWICRCDCGNLVSVAANHLSTNKIISCGCIGSSKGEVYIEQLLKENNIPFKREISYPDLLDKKKLRFDFGIYDVENQIQYLIEFDGIQHFKTSGGWFQSNQVKLVQKHDQMKNEYCNKNHIPLIRIPYTQLPILSIKDLKLETTKYQVC